MIWLAIALGLTALAFIAAGACVIDGRSRDRYADPAIELEAMAHRWATETRQLVDTATELGTEWANTARIISEEK